MTIVSENLLRSWKGKKEYHDKFHLKIEEEKKRDADRRELFQYDYGRKQFTDFNPRKHCDTYYNFDDKKEALWEGALTALQQGCTPKTRDRLLARQLV